MSKYTLDFNSFMNEGTKPKSGANRILEDADKNLLNALAEIEKLELESETEPKEASTVTPLKEKKKGIWDNIRAKRERGEKPAKKGSEAYKKAQLGAGEKIPEKGCLFLSKHHLPELCEKYFFLKTLGYLKRIFYVLVKI